MSEQESGKGGLSVDTLLAVNFEHFYSINEVLLGLWLIFRFLVVKDTLENRGVLNQIKARLRAEVFSALDDNNEQKPALSNENLLINELIREYLEFNGYKYTASVLLSGILS